VAERRGCAGAGWKVYWRLAEARSKNHVKYAALIAAAALLLVTPAFAQKVTNSAPQPAAATPALPAPRDVAYPGVLTLDIDATDLDRRIFTIRQTIPVTKAGRLTLLYSEWIPGNHAPRGPIYNYSGLRFTAGGKALTWTRDPADVFAFHVDVPSGVESIEVEAQFLSAIETAQGPIMMTPEMLRLNWYIGALYPAGHYARKVNFDVSVKLPPGWDYATALETASVADGVVHFKTASWETVIDSPLFAGKYMRKYDLDPGGRSRVTLNVMGDEAAQADASSEIIQVHRNLVVQADKLFGARHYDHYEFLLSVSERLATSGIEHQRSSDNGVRSGYFTAWTTGFVSKDLLAHEYVHSWNGKYRRPAELWTPNFNVPMRGGLLWVYEGQTQYWGHVLAARAGFVSKQQALDLIANNAATYQTRTGREWRALADTTLDPVIAARRSLPWHNWQRSEDYYSEGQLIWMDVDTLIRERSGGKRSLDDFARAFFGVNDGDWGQLTYSRKDLVAALNKVEPYNWEAFLAQRVDQVAPEAPLDGLERGGYRLVFGDTANAVWRDQESRTRTANLLYSIGLSADSAGKITYIQWDGPAFKAKLNTSLTITGVNGQSYSPERLRAAVAASINQPVDLLIRFQDEFRTVRLDYNGGHRYPRLERIAGKPALIDDILAAR
jgi:predicted metalloprotease with PDZ domain